MGASRRILNRLAVLDDDPAAAVAASERKERRTADGAHARNRLEPLSEEIERVDLRIGAAVSRFRKRDHRGQHAARVESRFGSKHRLKAPKGKPRANKQK
jgi:hypothetical protein